MRMQCRQHGRGRRGQGGRHGRGFGPGRRGGFSRGFRHGHPMDRAMPPQETAAAPAVQPMQATQAMGGFCPLCENHCPLSDPACPKGRAHAASLRAEPEGL